MNLSWAPAGPSKRRLVAESDSQILLVYIARPGTESADRLRLLGVVGGQQFAAAGG
jgi:hypothetical protein